MKIVSNNPQVKLAYNSSIINYVDGSYLDVLNQVKDDIINNKFKLLTHPLSGSIKPNETYYKSIMIDDKKANEIDMESLEYIEEAIEVYHKFIGCKDRPNWSEEVLDDFAIVDFYLIKGAINSANINQ